MASGKSVMAFMLGVVGLIVVGVHYDQSRGKRVMHAGVLRDMERVRLRREAQQKESS